MSMIVIIYIYIRIYIYILVVSVIIVIIDIIIFSDYVHVLVRKRILEESSLIMLDLCFSCGKYMEILETQ